MQLKPPRVGIGDRVTIKGITHQVVRNYSGKKGGQVFINTLKTMCTSIRFHNMSFDRTDSPVSCLACLMKEVDDAGM